MWRNSAATARACRSGSRAARASIRGSSSRHLHGGLVAVVHQDDLSLRRYDERRIPLLDDLEGAGHALIVDSIITGKVKSAFVDSKTAFNSVKVVTERGVVYLMGLVTKAEAEAATNIARTTAGVTKVVTLFEYID